MIRQVHSKAKMSKRHALLAGIATVLLSVACQKAQADVISGPVLNLLDYGYSYAGIGFTANSNATLTSFVFQNQGASDTVYLYDSGGNVVDSIGTPAATPSYAATVNWGLTAGVQYYLLQSTLNNAKWAYWAQALPSDSEISLTDSGIFSNAPPPSSNFIASGDAYWAAFNDIATTSSVPEPATLALFGIGLAGVGFSRRRKQV